VTYEKAEAQDSEGMDMGTRLCVGRIHRGLERQELGVFLNKAGKKVFAQFLRKQLLGQFLARRWTGPPEVFADGFHVGFPRQLAPALLGEMGIQQGDLPPLRLLSQEREPCLQGIESPDEEEVVERGPGSDQPGGELAPGVGGIQVRIVGEPTSDDLLVGDACQTGPGVDVGNCG